MTRINASSNFLNMLSPGPFQNIARVTRFGTMSKFYNVQKNCGWAMLGCCLVTQVGLSGYVWLKSLA